jgi:hypothetical protein
MRKKKLYALTIKVFTLEPFTKTIMDLTFAELQKYMQGNVKAYGEIGVQFTITESWEE